MPDPDESQPGGDPPVPDPVPQTVAADVVGVVEADSLQTTVIAPNPEALEAGSQNTLYDDGEEGDIPDGFMMAPPGPEAFAARSLRVSVDPELAAQERFAFHNIRRMIGDVNETLRALKGKGWTVNVTVNEEGAIVPDIIPLSGPINPASPTREGQERPA